MSHFRSDASYSSQDLLLNSGAAVGCTQGLAQFFCRFLHDWRQWTASMPKLGCLRGAPGCTGNFSGSKGAKRQRLVFPSHVKASLSNPCHLSVDNATRHQRLMLCWHFLVDAQYLFSTKGANLSLTQLMPVQPMQFLQ